MRAVAAELPPPAEDAAWAYEVKWDGYRVLAEVTHDIGAGTGSVRLWSSNGNDRTERFGAVTGVWEGLNAASAVLDGEVVALGPDGSVSFQLVQRNEGALRYVIFDVLAVNGRDTTGLAYTDRRRLLDQLLEPGPAWEVGAWQIGGGAALAAATAAAGHEGVIAKRADSRYLPGVRSPVWRKVKHRRQQEVVIGGWLPGSGARASTFGALLVGVHDGAGALRYSGRVGTGFDDATLRALLAALEARATPTMPFAATPPFTRAELRSARWVRPELVAEVAFTEWSIDGHLRHPSFLGLRDDKDPAEIVREPG
jgi:bifunctional non-homologous end joining protein LigD